MSHDPHHLWPITSPCVHLRASHSFLCPIKKQRRDDIYVVKCHLILKRPRSQPGIRNQKTEYYRYERLMLCCFDNMLFWKTLSAHGFIDVLYNTICYELREHRRADPLNKTNVLLCCSTSLSILNKSDYPDWNDWNEIHTWVGTFWLPASHWSDSAHMRQPIRHTSQIGQSV